MRITVEAENPQEFDLLAAAVQFIATQQRSPVIVTPPPGEEKPPEAPAEPVVIKSSSALALDAARDLVEKKGLPAATKLLEVFGVKRVSELVTERHAAFIEQARALSA